jgi:hypothetical protein
MNDAANATAAGDATKRLLLRGALRFMQPIVRLLLKVGVTHAEFSELCKAVFVLVASEDYGIRGRKANNSRIAILTGLGRKQVRAQLDLLEQEHIAEPSQMSPATRVITAWHVDPEFLDPQGEPLPLPLEGKTASFNELARRYAGDIPVSALLKELRRVDAVVDTDDDRIRIVSRSFLSTAVDPDYVRILATQLQDLGATVLHNFALERDEERRLQRYVVSENLPPKFLREFQAMATRESQALLEKLDDWLTRHEVDADERGTSKTARTGVGVYFFADDQNRRQRRK